jgi:DNA-binding XRE family transcriptional regulator
VNAIASLRSERGWTQVRLAQEARIAWRTVWAVEHGQPCRIPTQRRILEALGLTWEDRALVFEQAPEAASIYHWRVRSTKNDDAGSCRMEVR